MTEKTFDKTKHRERPEAGELFDRIEKLIYEYEGMIGTAEAVGVLELVKESIIRGAGGD